MRPKLLPLIVVIALLLCALAWFAVTHP
jgi:hypothetical protein